MKRKNTWLMVLFCVLAGVSMFFAGCSDGGGGGVSLLTPPPKSCKMDHGARLLIDHLDEIIAISNGDKQNNAE